MTVASTIVPCRINSPRPYSTARPPRTAPGSAHGAPASGERQRVAVQVDPYQPDAAIPGGQAARVCRSPSLLALRSSAASSSHCQKRCGIGRTRWRRALSQVRAWADLFRHRKPRYRGLAKNTAQLYTLFSLANLVIPRKPLLVQLRPDASRSPQRSRNRTGEPS
jgi:hypothetical protein